MHSVQFAASHEAVHFLVAAFNLNPELHSDPAVAPEQVPGPSGQVEAAQLTSQTTQEFKVEAVAVVDVV